MRGPVLAVLLAFAGSTAWGEEIEQLPPWVITEAPLRNVPATRAGAFLPDEAWNGRSITTFADAFHSTPGALLQESFGGFEPPRVSIRGSGVQSAPSSRGVALRLDGLPIGLADGSFNTALIDPLLFGAIEIARGLDGWRADPSVAGGALDFRRRTPAKSQVAARVEAGSFAALGVHASGSAVSNGAAVVGGLSLARQSGYRDHSGQNRIAAIASGERQINPQLKLSAALYHARAEYDVPGGLTLTASETTPRSVSADVWRDRPHRTADLSRVATSVERVDRELEFSGGLAFGQTTDDFRQLQANGVTQSRSNDVHAGVRGLRRIEFAGHAHELRASATASRGWRHQQRFLNQNGDVGARFADDKLTPTTMGAQFEDSFAVSPAVVGTLGAAHLWARRAIDDAADRRSPATRGFSTAATLPAASLRWHATHDSALFATVSQVAEPATFDDLLVTSGPGTALVRRSQQLAVQKATTWEIGARGTTARLAWEAMIYHAQWQNEILRLADATGAARGAVNAGRTRHEGIESSARWVVSDQPVRAVLSATATWNAFRFEHDAVYGCNRIAGIPPHFGTMEIVIEKPRGGFFALGNDWTAGATRVDHAGRLSYGGRGLTHVRMGWRNRPYWTCYAEVQNLFDRRAPASTAGVLDLARNPATTALFLPAVGRRLMIGVEWER